MALLEEEKQLVVQLQNNDLTSFNTLYYRHHQAVFRNICRLIYKYEVAEDILQEVFIALWEHRLTLDPDKPVAGWLFVVSYNRAMSWLKNAVKEAREIKIVVETTGKHEETQLPEQRYTEQLKILNGAVEKLPLRKKQAFTLCKLEGRSYEEAGSILGISTDTVKGYIKMSNRLIRQHINSENNSAVLVGATSMINFLLAYHA